MSANKLLHFQRRSWNTTPFDAGQPTGLPGGYWVAALGDEGDGTGGVISFQHIFSNPVGINRRDNNYYSLEELSVADSLATAHEYHMEINGMDGDTLGTGAPAIQVPVTRHWTINAQGHGVTVSNNAHAMNLWRSRLCRVWIGNFHGLETQFGDILIETDNIGGAETMEVVMQGLWWPPGSQNGPRGIIRPVDTIYGA